MVLRISSTVAARDMTDVITSQGCGLHQSDIDRRRHAGMGVDGIAGVELDEQMVSVVVHGADGRTVDEYQTHAANLGEACETVIPGGLPICSDFFRLCRGVK